MPYVVAGGLALAALVEVPSDSPVWLVLAFAITLPVVLVRAQPVVAAVLVVTAVFSTLLMGGEPPLAGLAALLVVLYVVGRHRSWRVTTALVAPFNVYAIAAGTNLSLALFVIAAFTALVGVVLQARDAAARRDESVQAMADTILEHAGLSERARIARELHDIVAHHISMVAVLADEARLTTPDMPPEGAKRLIKIGDTARAALTEMRRLLGVLREETSPEPARQPQPGLPQLNQLIDEARRLSAGNTRLIVRGAVEPLDPGIELTAYRIVQEALTNARRHAPGAAVDVELDYRDDVLHLRVRDNGPGGSISQTGATGHGLTGMRERLTMVGGRLSTRTSEVGGFVVEAVIPK